MTPDTRALGHAAAKINLGLRVTGKRDDGYHLLDSAVVFANLGDELTVHAADGFALSVSGPFAPGVPTDDRNLVLRAARLMAELRGPYSGARFHLTKRLPHAAGIGSASSDASAAIRLLSGLWNVPPLTGDEAVALGADVPVCLAAPRGQRMTGVGERLIPLPPLPECGIVLVNPGVGVPTKDVFAGLDSVNNPGLEEPPADGWPDAPGFADWVARQSNDLEPAARAIAPEIDRALSALQTRPEVLVSVMSGSGATCVGLTRNIALARQVARVLQLRHQGWWVAPAELLT